MPKCSCNVSDSNELNIETINRRGISDLLPLRIYHDFKVFQSQWLHATRHCHRFSVGTLATCVRILSGHVTLIQW